METTNLAQLHPTPSVRHFAFLILDGKVASMQTADQKMAGDENYTQVIINILALDDKYFSTTSEILTPFTVSLLICLSSLCYFSPSSDHYTFSCKTIGKWHRVYPPEKVRAGDLAGDKTPLTN